MIILIIASRYFRTSVNISEDDMTLPLDLENENSESEINNSALK